MRTGGKRELRGHGKCFIGTEASLILDRTGYSIVNKVPAGQKILSPGPFVNQEETVLPSPDASRHYGLFIKYLRNRKQPTANVETLHAATTAAHLMNISWEVGRPIHWDAENHRLLRDPQAQKLVLCPYRAPWKLEV